MTYTKTTWVNGSAPAISAANLQNIEDGIETLDTGKAPLASPTFTGTVTVPVGLTGVLRADTGVVSVSTVAVADGGTGASTAATARTNLGFSDSFIYVDNTGTDIVKAHDAEVVVPVAFNVVKTITLTVTPDASLSISFDFDDSIGYIVRNSTQVGTVVGNGSGYVTYNEVIAGWVNGDILTLVARRNTLGVDGRVKNLRIIGTVGHIIYSDAMTNS